MEIVWLDAQKLSDIEAVNDALTAFNYDSTEDNAVNVIQEVIKAYRATFQVTADKAEVPENFQIVPVELTQEMIDAFNEAQELFEDGIGVSPECHWSAMLAVAPLPPLKDGAQ